MQSLAEMSEGQSATISEISGDDAVAMRLMEMGLTDGECVKLIGRAPMGDPVEISIRGYRLSLRLSEAARVVIKTS
jgi:ferrous iron transport protein A